jgi:hypothetical protein
MIHTKRCHTTHNRLSAIINITGNVTLNYTKKNNVFKRILKYLMMFVESYAPPIPTSTMATSTYKTMQDRK